MRGGDFMIDIKWLINTMRILLIFDVLFISAVLIRKIVNYVLVKSKRQFEHDNLHLIEKCLQTSDISALVDGKHGRISKLVIKEILADKFPSASLVNRFVMNAIADHFGIYERDIKQLKSLKWWVQANAAYDLGVFRVKESLPMLIEKLEKSRNREVRIKAGEAILKISSSRHLLDVMDNIQTLNKRNHNHLIDLIANIEEDIFPVMEIVLLKSNLLSIRISIEVLGKKQDERVLPYAFECLESGDIEVMISALKSLDSLGEISDPEYILPSIMKLKDHKLWVIRSFVAKVLKHYRFPKCYVVLKDMIGDSSWRVRYNAGISLATMGSQGVFSLSEILFTPDRFARDMAWQLLQKEKLINHLSQFDAEDTVLKQRTLRQMDLYLESQNE